jgi:hypothetical protein
VSDDAQGASALGQRLTDEAGSLGLPRRALLVMSKTKDPYFLDTPTNRRAGQWFAVALDRLLAPGRSIHLRGLHYLLVTTALIRPDGSIYVNDLDCWEWLQDDASKAARWLRLADFERIHDARNDDPIWGARDTWSPEATQGRPRKLLVSKIDTFGIEIPRCSELLPRLGSVGSAEPSQAFRFGFIGEKSSLRPTVEPFADRYEMDVVLDTGDASDSHLYEMARRAAVDGRPFVVFYVSDFDPSGHNMPVAVSRKFQALCDGWFPDLDLRLYPVALALEQCIEHNLPSAPLKPTERRKDNWLARFGREQTEIDALLALAPGVLESLLETAIAPFYDPTLHARYQRAVALPRRVHEWFKRLPEVGEASDEITELHAAVVDATNELIGVVERHATAVQQAVENAPDAPALKSVNVEPDLPDEKPEHGHDDDDDDA